MNGWDKQMKTDLHCGACGEKFNDIKMLAKHLDVCYAAKVLLPLINKVVFLKLDKTGHPAAHFITLLAKNNHLIDRYANCIATEMYTIERAKIHYELCEKLGLDYNKFRPFESSDIKKIPDKDECLKILWSALEQEGNNYLKI